jgi:hypothetical protein
MIDIKLPISVLGLNVRALNCLKYGTNIKTIEDLILYEANLLRLPNLAKGTHNHIKETLAKHDLYLKTDSKSLEVNPKSLEVKSHIKDYIIEQQKNEIEALRKLVEEQDRKILDLVFDLAYANRSDEFRNDPIAFAKAVLKEAIDK